MKSMKIPKRKSLIWLTFVALGLSSCWKPSDFENIIKEYLDGKIPADAFLEKLGIFHENSKSNSVFKKRLTLFFGVPHKCMYDKKSLLMLLKEIGFDAIIKCPFNSNIKDINIIEIEERTKNSVIVEGTKK